jgi:hypothetical protein
MNSDEINITVRTLLQKGLQPLFSSSRDGGTTEVSLGRERLNVSSPGVGGGFGSETAGSAATDVGFVEGEDEVCAVVDGVLGVDFPLS